VQQRPVRVASVCTGMHAERVISQALGIDTQFAFAADPKPAALCFNRQNGEMPPHWFGNLEHLAEGGAGHCLLHDGECGLPDGCVDIMGAGTPCQPYTKTRAKRKREGALSHRQAHIIEITLKLCQDVQPRAIVLENVTGFMERESTIDDTTPYMRLKDSLALFLPTWAFRTFRLDAKLWLPESRPRIWTVILRPDTGDEATLDAIEQQLEEIHAYRLALPLPSMDDVLLKPDSMELAHAISMLEEEHEVHQRPAREGQTKWKDKGQALRQQLGEPPFAAPWTARPGTQLRGLRAQPRVLDLLDIRWMSRCVECGVGFKPEDDDGHIREGFWVGTSQDVSRQSSLCYNGIRPSRTSHSVFYSYRLDRVETAKESLMALGYGPSVQTRGLSSAHVRDLSGEAQALASAASVSCAVLLHGNFPGLWAPNP